MKSLRLAVYAMIFLLYLPGCAITVGGAKFVEIEPVPKNMGAVYFYRPPISKKSLANLDLIDNGKPIGSIQNGQFKRILVSPRYHRFQTDTIVIDESVGFNVQSGETYYVRVGLIDGYWTHTWYLRRANELVAQKEMGKCCKSGEE